MEFALGLINLILIFILVRRLLTLFYESRVVIKVNNAQSEEEKSVVQEIATEIVQDEVCNRSIPKKEAHILVQGEDKYYFCSWDCREKFLNSY